jgi:hypothetical protein
MDGSMKRLRRGALAVVVAVTATVSAGSGGAPVGADPLPADDVRLNEIQVVGSHNSYHLAASPEETAIRRGFIGAGDDLLQYSHAPLAEQLEEQKVRQIELDIFRDDEGGAYREPLLRAAAGHGAYDPAMDAPGTKVLHVQDVDYRSTCLSLVACLTAVEDWSDAHPDHLPIAILLELKDDEVPFDGPFVVPEPWDTDAMDALDEEIRSVVPAEEMITPDDVRGEAATLEDAVLDTGWPTLGEARGKVMFLMDNEGGYRTDYLAGHPSLTDRVMFTSAAPGDDDAAFVKVNDSRGNVSRIQDLVAEGYVVRTRSDAETVEAREGDTSARDAAFQSGAQWVSTDYPVGEYARPFGTGFLVEIPGGTVARCNPVNGPDGCVSAELEPFPERAETPYVSRLFEVFFGRAPSNPEQWYWARRLERGTSRTSVARSLSRSRDIATGQFVLDPSLDLLHRELDRPSAQYWADYLASGRPYEHMLVGFLASNELYATGGDDGGWIEVLFERVLDRTVDEPSLDYFVGRLEAGAKRWTIARQILGSLESRRLRVVDLVGSILERDATTEELTRFAEQIRLTRDERDVAVALVATDEFHD